MIMKMMRKMKNRILGELACAAGKARIAERAGEQRDQQADQRPFEKRHTFKRAASTALPPPRCYRRSRKRQG